MPEKEIEYVEVVDHDARYFEIKPASTSAANTTMKNSNLEIQQPIETTEENELTIKARTAGNALSDLTTTAIDKAKDKISKKAKGLSTAVTTSNTTSIAAAKDAKDISFLGPMVVEELARSFEEEIREIARLSY